MNNTPATPGKDIFITGGYQIPVILFGGIAILSQLGFWFYSMPWPQLQQPQSIDQATTSCVVAALVLLLIPAVIALSFKRRLIDLGIGLGDASFGLKAVFWLAPVLAIGTWIGSSDPQIQAFYPIPGDSIETAGPMIQWFFAYLLYYIAFEFFYRGYLLRGLGEPNSIKNAWKLIALQAVCCFLIHVGKPNAELIASFPASLLFGWIAWRSRSIWYGVVIHFAIGIVNDLGAM